MKICRGKKSRELWLKEGDKNMKNSSLKYIILLINKEIELNEKLDDYLGKKSYGRRQKFREVLLKKGDKNTKFFMLIEEYITELRH